VTDAGATYSKATQDYKFAAAVAAFGMILRDSPHKGTATLAAVTELAQEGLGRDESGYRREFLDLVEKAKPLVRPTGPATDSVLYPKGDTDGQF
jgi:Ca-activated chloride channel family protein